PHGLCQWHHPPNTCQYLARQKRHRYWTVLGLLQGLGAATTARRHRRKSLSRLCGITGLDRRRKAATHHLQNIPLRGIRSSPGYPIQSRSHWARSLTYQKHLINSHFMRETGDSNEIDSTNHINKHYHLY